MLFIGQDGLFSRDIFDLLRGHFGGGHFTQAPFAEKRVANYEFIVWHAQKIHPQQLAKLKRDYSDVPILLITDSIFKQAENTVCFNTSMVTIINAIEMLSGGCVSVPKNQYSLKEELILYGIEKSNKELARFYDVSVSDIKYHKQKLYQKLGVANKREAMLLKS